LDFEWGEGLDAQDIGLTIDDFRLLIFDWKKGAARLRTQRQGLRSVELEKRLG
jgi:hypothetical protein